MLADSAWVRLKHKKLHFQHDKARLHYDTVVREWLDEKFAGRWIGRRARFDWPTRLPDLIPCNFFLWNYLKDILFRQPSATLMQSPNKIEQACAQVTETMYDEMCHSLLQPLCDCFDPQEPISSIALFLLFGAL